MNKILLRIAFILALIIAIALIAIVIIRYTPRFFSYISSASTSLFNVFKKDSLELQVTPQTIESDHRVTISWPTENQEAVSLTYTCNNEYNLSYLSESNTRLPIRCGEEFELGGTAEDVVVIPVLTKAGGFNDIEIEIEQKRTNDSTASGIAVITVTSEGVSNNNQPATTTRPSLTSTTTPNTNNQSNNQNPTKKPSTGGPLLVNNPTVSGPANLTLSQPQYINSIGPVVQFTVTNNGGKNTGVWEIRASLPNGDMFNSGTLVGLPAGASSLFTLNLGTTVRGNNTVRITLDPNNVVSEGNENDNTKEVSFVSGTGSNPTNSGRADLSIRILSIGYIQGDTIGIRFEIRNNGGTTAKDWRFEADLPTDDDEDTFESKEQPDLKPGEAIEYTLGFDDPISNGFATIEVDSDDDVRESDENNNRIRFRVTN
jgi:CARDB